MRQVPFVNYLIIGSGRMATHFCHYLSLLHLPYQNWSRNKHTEASLGQAIQDASHIVVLINDSAIPLFVKTWQKENDDKRWVHFSGQLTVPGITGAHPLMTFTSHLYDIDTYHSIPFVLGSGALPFEQVLPHLPNKAHRIPGDLKTFYHAMCVMSGNFTCLVWQKFFKELTITLGVPHDIAIPYFKQIVNNILTSPKDCLTGPLVRGDKTTISSHLKALENDDFLPIYQAVLQYFAHKETV
jgi:hypothetical protein